MATESIPDHIRTPHVRPFQPVGVQKDGKQFVALRDPSMLSNQTMVVPPQVLQVLQFFRGEEDIDAMSRRTKIDAAQLKALAEGLDRVGLLWGPTYERLEAALKEQINARGALPVGASGMLGQDAAKARAQIERWLSETDDPEIEQAVVGIVAPHLDYPRGWPNYAAAYRCLERVERPTRVVVLGTNHFGVGDGAITTRWGFDSPLGRNGPDAALVEALVSRVGEAVVVDQVDHVREHSVQLHMPWIHHRWGDVPVFAALVPDPLAPMIADDGKRIAFEPFVAAMRAALDEAGGTTFFVASADLSHVGPQFGEPRPVDQQRKHDVELHDREMMSKYIGADVEEFIGAMKWCNNPTRWCSIGNMAAALALAKPSGVELIDYRQACDDQGRILVSSAAMALV